MPAFEHIGIAESSIFYTQIISDILPPMYARTPHGKIAFANKSFCQLVHADHKDVIGRSEELFLTVHDIQQLWPKDFDHHHLGEWRDSTRERCSGVTWRVHYKPCNLANAYHAAHMDMVSSRGSQDGMEFARSSQEKTLEDFQEFEHTVLAWLTPKGDKSEGLSLTPSDMS